MHFLHKLSVVVFLSFLFVIEGEAQNSFVNNDPDDRFKVAKEYYQKEFFSLAYPLFKTVTNDNSHFPVTVKEEANYYSIVCALKLNEATAVDEAIRFIDLQHNLSRVQMMAFHLAEYYVRRQAYSEALGYYEKTDAANLSNREVADMKFHQAYAYFSSQQFTKAKPLFDAIRQMPDDPNYVDANYYFGFISFYEKNYKQALLSFKVVENEPAYVRLVPYYLAQIYYFTGDKDKAISYGEDMLKRGGQYYEVQLKQLIGHSYFEKQDYTKALPYLEEYVAASDKVRREDLYELAYCYYKVGSLNKAIDGFKQLGGKEDSLAQNSMYLLADAYLKTNQKTNARNAFLFSATNSSNAVQKEISQFNYGKLSYELGYNDVALNELQNFVVKYPKSTYTPEAKDLLVQVMAIGNNFKDALALFRTLTSQSENVKRLFPRVLYGRAVELINDQQLRQGEQLLNELMTSPYNQSLLPYAYFWKGEISFRKEMYDSATYFTNQYLRSPVTTGEVTPTNARYTMGYSLLRLQEYPRAYDYFVQVTGAVSNASSAVEQDAYLRQGDALFMQRGYQRALQVYDNVIKHNLVGADYALYQKAIIAGATNKTEEKIQLLESLASRYPQSSLIADAQLELGNTLMAEENYGQAVMAFTKVIGNAKAENLKPEAYLNLGLAYYNNNNNSQALEAFKSVVSRYPNSEEATSAIEYVKSIYVEQQRPQDFVSFMKQNNRPISYSEEDSLTYASADARFTNEDYENALRGLEAYVKNYASGKHVIEANFRIGWIYHEKKNYQHAVSAYSVVSAKAPNAYAEQATLNASRIYYFELADYPKAEENFTLLKQIATQPENRLEAMRGLLRSQYKLEKFTEAAPNAKELLSQKGIATDDKMMANLVIARTHHANKENAEASNWYRQVVNLGRSEFSAEARYRLAEIQFEENKLADAEKLAFETINKSGSYDYWVTSAYILLGEIYFKQKDFFNAEATLKSVAENAANEELKAEARQLLNQVVEEKNKQSKVQQ